MAWDWLRSQTPRRLGWVAAVAAMAIALESCQPPEDGRADWAVYRNERFGFAFPYPGNWQSQPPPTNLDGRVLFAPDDPEVRVRAWAGYDLETNETDWGIFPASGQSHGRADRPDEGDSEAARESLLLAQLALQNELENTVQPNFTVASGARGQLQVDIGDRTSTIRLQLSRDEVIYYWQAEAPSDKFASYYRLFDYMARQYRIEEATED